jgi:hypothetical protein
VLAVELAGTCRRIRVDRSRDDELPRRGSLEMLPDQRAVIFE